MPTTLIERLRVLMHTKQMNATQLAEELQVQRSSISHLINGRNKPSLDFLQKISQAFPDVDLNWLVSGTSFPAPSSPSLQMEKTAVEPALPVAPVEQSVTTVSTHVNKVTTASPTPIEVKKPAASSAQPAKGKRELEKIMLLYSDGTFEVYRPGEPGSPTL